MGRGKWLPVLPKTGGKGLGWFRKGQNEPRKRGLGVSWFPRVGWGGFGKAQISSSCNVSSEFVFVWKSDAHTATTMKT